MNKQFLLHFLNAYSRMVYGFEFPSDMNDTAMLNHYFYILKKEVA